MTAKYVLNFLLFFIFTLTLFSQEGYFILNQGTIDKPEDMTTKVLLHISVEKKGNNFQVTGTYYEYRSKSWNNIGNLTGTLYANNKFKGEKNIYSSSENVDGEYVAFLKRFDIGEYRGFNYETELTGVYYKNGNENDVCRISQEGPFVEFNDENSNITKGVLMSTNVGSSIDGGFFFSVDKEQIEFNGVIWKRKAGSDKNFTGDWNTNWGSLKLIQSGSNVSGTYGQNGGRVENGKVATSGDTLVCNGDWIGPDSKGKFIFKILGDALWGSWNYSTSPETWYHDWNGSRW